MNGDTKHIPIPDSLEGERLDKALATAEGEMSRSTLQRLIREGHITLAHRILTDVRHKVRAGEIYTVTLPAPVALDTAPEEIPLTIVHEDGDLIVIDKPAGLAVHPGAGLHSGTLVNALLHHCGGLPGISSLTGIGGVIRPGVVHRLDKETSGLLVAAKTDKAHLHLSRQFKDHTVSRCYLAILVGIPKQATGRIETHLGRHPVHRQKMAVLTDKGRVAITHYQVLASHGPLAVVRCRLETGRTHQIRVHMAHLGHPLLGDPVYGKPFQPPSHWPGELARATAGFSRQALHAETLGFIHPTTGQRLEFRTPPPRDMAMVLEWINFCQFPTCVSP